LSDPSRSGPGLIVHSTRPYNAEPPLDRLVTSFVTPQTEFYVRCHGDIPALDEAAHRLRVGGRVATPLELSLAELRERFPRRTVRAVMQCAGNRRADLHQVRPVSGDPWAGAAIGNASWTGTPLAAVLEAAGVERGPTLHVAFAACDECEADGLRFRYGASIPLAKALSPEVLLAYEMNGEPLTPEHGFPLRVVVPGYAGCRSPKWLAGIEVRDGPSDNPMQAREYKLFPPDVTEETADWDRGLTIDEMPLNAAICEPADGATLPAGAVAVRGWAVASGRAVARVDVSADGGRTWRQAELLDDLGRWAWRHWRATVELPPGDHEILVRAWDSSAATQPEDEAALWNPKGYVNNARPRVRVRAT
jgi:sulfite oxidase